MVDQVAVSARQFRRFFSTFNCNFPWGSIDGETLRFSHDFGGKSNLFVWVLKVTILKEKSGHG